MVICEDKDNPVPSFVKVMNVKHSAVAVKLAAGLKH